MGVITIKVDDEVEKKFREVAKEEFNKKKGYLGKGVTEALEKWVSEQRSEKAKQRILKRMREGYNLGELQYKNRAELHER